MRIFRYASIFVLIASTLLALPSPAALAGGWGDGGCAVGLTPNTGQVGSIATISIKSSAFPVDGDFKIRWSTTAAFDPEQTVVVKEGVVAKNSYEVNESFTIPEARYGNHHVQFWRFNRDDMVGFTFTVRPRLEVTPAQAEPGAKITIKCTGFPTTGGGTITFDGKPTDIQIAPNAKGTFTTEFTVPVTLAGDHKFVASSPQVFTEVLTAMVKVTPVLIVEPKQPDVGADVKLTGSGFAAKSPVKIRYDNITLNSPPTTDDNGSFTYTFKVPESSAKDHKITVEDGAGNTRVWGMVLEGKPPPKPTTVAPRNERFGWFGDQTVTFAWTPVSDMSGVNYTIEVAEDLRFFPLKPGMKKTGLTQPNTTITMKTGTYYWRVQAVDGVGNASEWVVSPFAFSVGFFETWMLAVAGVICLLIFILLIRAFFRRLREYY